MDNFFYDIIASLWQIMAVVFRALSPLIIGLLIAYLLNPAVEWVGQKITGGPQGFLSSRRPKGRVIAILITYTSALGLIFLIIYAFVVLILGALPSGGIQQTAEKVYDYFASSYQVVTDFLAKYLPGSLAEKDYNPEADFVAWLEKRFSFNSIFSMMENLAGALVSFFIGLVASVYLLRDKEFFLSLWQKFLSVILRQRSHGLTNEVLDEINKVLSTFIKGALIDSLIVALLSSLALSLLKVKFAVIIGLLGGILNIIPYFGPFFGMAPAFLIALVTAGLGQAVMALLALLVVQQIDSNYIYPKVVGASVGLHPLFVLLSVSAFGYFGGIAGMLLAVPVAGIIQVLIKRWAYRV